MKEFIRKNIVLLIIAFVSAIGLFVLSYLTILNYSYEMEEQYIIACNSETIHELETSIAYGKNLKGYYGLPEILNKAAELLRDGSILVVEGTDGKAIASTRGEEDFQVDLSKYSSVEQEIKDKEGKTAGYMLSYYPKDSLKAELRSPMLRSGAGSLIIFVILLIVYFVAGIKWKLSMKRLIYVVVVGILGQGIFLTMNYTPRFEEAAQKSVYGVASYLEETLNSMVEKGVMPSDIDDLDQYLEKKAASYDWISDIYSSEDTIQETENRYVVPIKGAGMKVVLAFDISESYIRQNVTEMVLTFLATIMIAVIVMMESLTLSEMLAFRKTEEFGKRCHPQFASIAQVLRYSNFLSSTFSYMCLSFAALQIKEWNQGFWGISPGIAAAMSISICSLAEAAGMLMMPAVAKKLNNKTLLTGSAILLIVANFACFFTTYTWMIILMRFFAGIGFAGNKQVSNAIISGGYDTEEEKSANLAGSNYGIIGGILCGMGLGSIIAGVFGYLATFLAAGVGCILYLIFNYSCVPWEMFVGQEKKEKESGTGESGSKGKLIKLITSFSIWKSILLVVTPQYFFLLVIVSLIPGRIQSGGFPAVVLTYANLLNGIFGLYVGEYLGKLLSKLLSRTKALALMFLFGVVGMFILELSVFPIVMILVSAILMGFIDGVGTPLATDIFLENKELVETMDETTALMVYSVLGFIIMTVAPVILELCEKSQAVMYGACGVLGVMAVLLFIGKENKA